MIVMVFAFLPPSLPGCTDGLSPLQLYQEPLSPPQCHQQHWPRGKCPPCAAHQCFSPFSVFFGSQRLILRSALLVYMMLKDVSVASIMRQSVVIELGAVPLGL